jgi:hypothetical protein
MEENAYQLSQYELEVPEVMKVHREEKDWSMLLMVNLPNMLN